MEAYDFKPLMLVEICVILLKLYGHVSALDKKSWNIGNLRCQPSSYSPIQILFLFLTHTISLYICIHFRQIQFKNLVLGSKKRSLITLNMYVRVYTKVFNWNFYCHLSQGDKQESHIRVPMFAHPRHVLVNYLHMALHMYM